MIRFPGALVHSSSVACLPPMTIRAESPGPLNGESTTRGYFFIGTALMADFLGSKRDVGQHWLLAASTRHPQETLANTGPLQHPHVTRKRRRPTLAPCSIHTSPARDVGQHWPLAASTRHPQETSANTGPLQHPHVTRKRRRPTQAPCSIHTSPTTDVGQQWHCAASTRHPQELSANRGTVQHPHVTLRRRRPTTALCITPQASRFLHCNLCKTLGIPVYLE